MGIKDKLLKDNYGKKLKSGVPFTRKYIVFFNYGTHLQNNYAIINSKSKEQALYDAWKTWGRSHVAKVDIANDQSEQVARLYGKTRII